MDDVDEWNHKRAKVEWLDSDVDGGEVRRISTGAEIRELSDTHVSIRSPGHRDPLILAKRLVLRVKPFVLAVVVLVVVLGLVATGPARAEVMVGVWSRAHAEGHGAEVCIYAPQDGAPVGELQNITVLVGVFRLPSNGTPEIRLVLAGEPISSPEIMDTTGYIYPVPLRPRPLGDKYVDLEVILRHQGEDVVLLTLRWEVVGGATVLPPDEIIHWDTSPTAPGGTNETGDREDSGPPAVVRAFEWDLTMRIGILAGGLLLSTLVWIVGLRAKRTIGIRSPYFPDNPFTRFIVIVGAGGFISWVTSQAIPLWYTHYAAYQRWLLDQQHGGPLQGQEFISPVPGWQIDVLVIQVFSVAFILWLMLKIYMMAYRRGHIPDLRQIVEISVRSTGRLRLRIRTFLGRVLEDRRGILRWLSVEPDDVEMFTCLSRLVGSTDREPEWRYHQRVQADTEPATSPSMNRIDQLLDTRLDAEIDGVQAIMVDRMEERRPGETYHDDRMEGAKLALDTIQGDQSPIDKKREAELGGRESITTHLADWLASLRPKRDGAGGISERARIIDVVQSHATLSPTRAIIDIEMGEGALEFKERARAYALRSARGLDNVARAEMAELIEEVLPTARRMAREHQEAARRRKYVNRTPMETLREMAKQLGSGTQVDTSGGGRDGQ